MSAIGKLTWVELKLFAREPFPLVFTFAFPIVLLLILVSLFGGDPPEAYGMPPADYYVSSYVGVAIAVIGLIAVPVHVANYRERGILRRFQASSVPPAATFGAQAIVGLLIATAAGMTLAVIGNLVHDVALPTSVGPVLAAFALGTLAFVAIGLLLAALAPGVRAAQAIGMLLFVPMWMLGGPGPPRGEMSGVMQSIHDAMPLTYVVRSLQDPWVGAASNPANLVVVAAILVVASAAALRLFRSPG
jgi:ABC-2 type transport system permease protein